MSGWSAMAGTHTFVVPGDTNAQSLAEALAAHGFAVVTAKPSDSTGWMVTALDEGPYPVDGIGHRMIEAVGREAALVAREHSGYPEGGSRFDVGLLQLMRSMDASITCLNPGARPPAPTIMVHPAPAPAPLALTPDHVDDGPIDLAGLNDVAWADLEHAHGSAADVPELLQALVDPSGDWDQSLDELFGDDLLHQGSCYSATAPALPFVARLILSGALPAKQRLDLTVWLLIAAGRWTDSLLVDADRAAVQGREPEAEDWTQDVHLAVGELLTPLLTRWHGEPPAMKVALACLAGLYPKPGRQVSGQVAVLAEQFAGTRPGSYLQLAEALIQQRTDQALTLAAGIVGWEDAHDPGWLEAPGLGAGVKAGHVLVEGALGVLSNTG